MITDGDDTTKPRRVIWHFTDGKPGHFNQALGLIEALRAHVNVDKHTIDVRQNRVYFLQWLLKRFPLGQDLPQPDMLVGAGRRTHRAMLAAKRVHRCPAVVMMKPQLPSKWFDHCIIPRHDGVSESANITLTDGVVNRIQPATNASPNAGLFLIGGPSKHHGWDEARILAQVREVVAADSSIHWTLTTSRRTPVSTTDSLCNLNEASLTVVPFEKTDPDWVGSQLKIASKVWVSEDSVSMVYEALTASAAVGMLDVPRAEGQHSRVVEGLKGLVQRGWVNTFEQWQATHSLAPCPVQLNEASRCAATIYEKFLAKQS